MPFDLARLKEDVTGGNRYERRLARLEREGRYRTAIEASVADAAANLTAGARSFVIYGEPQSGKTEMMIALTAKLPDEGHRIIVVLLNDNVQLLQQNLSRFRNAGLDPAPKYFEEVLHKDVSLQRGEWIIFCKKNVHDLPKLNEKLRAVKDAIIVLDDEADYATPNAKVNKKERTRINALVGQLLNTKGIYIGVTATPARLDLNKTFNNQAERWVLFAAHPHYKGHAVFFPVILGEQPAYHRTFLPPVHDAPKFLRTAIFGFLVNVAHLNTQGDSEKNFSMLIHTSGARVDHSGDYDQVQKLFSALADPSNRSHEAYYEQIWELAEARFPGKADAITTYILRNVGRHTVVVMNSDKRSIGNTYETATSPTTPFTIAIGGNIVSRGVTFDNLLSMFFTRDVKHKIQQDTYMQRARMFGSRGAYLKHFELSIPEGLYKDWQRCFLFHTLALAAITDSHKSPVWIEDSRISAASASSVDRASVNMDSGEMSFAVFDYDEVAIDNAILDAAVPALERLARLQAVVGVLALPDYLVSTIQGLCPKGDASVAVHGSSSIAGYKDASVDKEQIVRRRGFMGASQLEHAVYPNAVHHIKVFHNGQGKARVFYKYDAGNIKFLKRGRGRGGD